MNKKKSTPNIEWRKKAGEADVQFRAGHKVMIAHILMALSTAMCIFSKKNNNSISNSSISLRMRPMVSKTHIAKLTT